MASHCLGQAQSSLDSALSAVKIKCTKEGRLDPLLLDQYQLVSYELAFCAAELEAAKSMLDYAGLNCKGDKLVENIVLSFCAQMIQSVLQRLLSQSADINIARQEICQQMSGPQLSQLFERYHSADNLASIGAQLIQGDVDTLASSLDAEKQMVRETFSRFAADIVAPLAEDIHRQDLDIPDTILSQAAELGCFGTCIPERFGGLMPDDKPDSLSMIVVTEELSKASLGAAGSLITRPEIAARALLKGGTAAQQQRWLPPLASGETLCAIAITEPDYGSDVASMTLKASRTAGGWLLNGSKTWSTFAAKSGLLVVLARSNPDTSLGHKGLSLFFVEKPIYAGHEFVHQQNAGDFTSQPETVGKLSGKAIATIGYRGMHSYDLFFEDYFVPGENLLGENEGEGRGFYYTMAGFSGGRIQTAARATGVMQAAYEKALSYSKQRRVFKKVLADYQLTQVKLARMQMTITAARQFSYAVASLMDQGKGQMQASLVKLFACRAAEWISREAMQIHGGMGYAEESAVSRYFVDARVLSIFEGAEETLALKVIAKDLIAKAK